MTNRVLMWILSRLVHATIAGLAGLGMLTAVCLLSDDFMFVVWEHTFIVMFAAVSLGSFMLTCDEYIAKWMVLDRPRRFIQPLLDKDT